MKDSLSRTSSQRALANPSTRTRQKSSIGPNQTRNELTHSPVHGHTMTYGGATDWFNLDRWNSFRALFGIVEMMTTGACRSMDVDLILASRTSLMPRLQRRNLGRRFLLGISSDGNSLHAFRVQLLARALRMNTRARIADKSAHRTDRMPFDRLKERRRALMKTRRVGNAVQLSFSQDFGPACVRVEQDIIETMSWKRS